MKKLLFLMILFCFSAIAHAQVYTDDGGGYSAPAPMVAPRYRLRQDYRAYPAPLAPGLSTNQSPDTVEVGRPYYSSPYYYGNPAGSSVPYGGVQSDGNSVYVPGN